MERCLAFNVNMKNDYYHILIVWYKKTNFHIYYSIQETHDMGLKASNLVIMRRQTCSASALC